jgi:molecular chaperone HtpG
VFGLLLESELFVVLLAFMTPSRLLYLIFNSSSLLKSACWYHDEFFDKFINLLQWRTNKGIPTTYSHEFTHDWRTLPEILEQLPNAEGEPQSIPYFSDRNSANQYFQMADAAEKLVVDASYPFEEQLIKQYAERVQKGSVNLIAVDQEDDPNVFRTLQAQADIKIKQLAEYMSQVIRPGGTGRIRVESLYFEPKELTALIRSTEEAKGSMKAREILNDPNTPEDLREMAQEMMRMSRNSSLRLILNAGNPMIRLIAQQNFEDANVLSLMLGIYNSAILYNQELMTPQNARIFYEDFQRLLRVNLDYIIEKTDLQRQTDDLERKRESMRKDPGVEVKHLIFFLMIPSDESYQDFIGTTRKVIENRFGCQLFVANDRQYKDTFSDNIRHHLDRAHAFIAEVTNADPHVMYQLGAARFDLRERPIVLIRKDNEQKLIPDLEELISIDYGDLIDEELIEHLETQLRKDERIKILLSKPGLERYISPKLLKEISKLPSIEEKTFQNLSEQYPTLESWQKANLAKVKDLIGKENADLAQVLLDRIQKGLSEVKV